MNYNKADDLINSNNKHNNDQEFQEKKFDSENEFKSIKSEKNKPANRDTDYSKSKPKKTYCICQKSDSQRFMM